MWGKATLSRSEPTWRIRKTKEMSGQRGFGLEGVTAQRRKERAEFKEERLKNERMERERLLHAEEGKNTADEEETPKLFDRNEGTNVSALEQPKRKKRKVRGEIQPGEVPIYSEEYLDKETLQLCPEEALFLMLLGLLQIRLETSSTALSLAQFLHLIGTTSRSDDPFLVRYIIYHHYRRQRLIVKPGLKFGVDYLLYDKPIPLTHARRCVNVLASYHLWPPTSHQGRLVKEDLTWQEINLWQRLMGTVRKRLVLCWVEIPFLKEGEADWRDVNTKEEFDEVLQRYKVKEVSNSRMIISRERDTKSDKKK